MDKSLHYFGIGFLARAAGFTKPDALTIAYASQYVDNATESEPIRVGEAYFDPVRTAHYGLRAFSWGVQKKIYIPFHFIPPRPFVPSPETFTFIVERNSVFANLVFKWAGRNSSDEIARLIAIGISLHTLADSWAHQGFSGREDQINDVEAICLFKEGTWKHLFLENIYLDILPQVGHAEAGTYPDDSFLRWKYTRAATKAVVECENLKEYSDAVKTIYQLLVSTRKMESAPVLPWNDIETQVLSLLADPEPKLEKRCDKWFDLYKSFFGDASDFRYDRYQWRDQALKPKRSADIAWDDYRQSDFKRLSFSMSPDFYETPWVKFHRAALRQRNFIMENLL